MSAGSQWRPWTERQYWSGLLIYIVVGASTLKFCYRLIKVLKCIQGQQPMVQTRRYSPLRGLTSSSWALAFGQAFFWAKIELSMLFVLIFSHFCCSVVTCVTFSITLVTLKIIQKKSKNLKVKKFRKSKKNLKKFHFFLSQNLLKIIKKNKKSKRLQKISKKPKVWNNIK